MNSNESIKSIEILYLKRLTCMCVCVKYNVKYQANVLP